MADWAKGPASHLAWSSSQHGWLGFRPSQHFINLAAKLAFGPASQPAFSKPGIVSTVTPQDLNMFWVLKWIPILLSYHHLMLYCDIINWLDFGIMDVILGHYAFSHTFHTDFNNSNYAGFGPSRREGYFIKSRSQFLVKWFWLPAKNKNVPPCSWNKTIVLAY